MLGRSCENMGESLSNSHVPRYAVQRLVVLDPEEHRGLYEELPEVRIRAMTATAEPVEVEVEY